MDNSIKYTFIVHPDFCDKFSSIVQILPQHIGTFIPVSANEFDKLFIGSKRGAVRQQEIISNNIYDLLLKYIDKIKPEKCILLYFDRFIKALIKNKPNTELYGILFSTGLRENKHLSFRTKFKYLRKKFRRRLYTRNNSVKKIFILNDSEGVDILNKQNKKNIFFYLPDPIIIHDEDTNFNLRAKYNISKSKKIFLHFGSFRNSKGTIEIIESLNLLTPKTSATSCLVLAGKPKNDSIKKQILETIKKNNGTQVVYIDEFISNAKMKALFNQCDHILMPYKNGSASSGVIGHAIVATKPVIYSNSGLIGELIKNNWMGEHVERVEPEEIAKAIEKSLNTHYPVIDNNSFIESHSPNNFAQTLLENLNI
ncbi:glycosyltransferase [uncultured Draconibacterium sp.]|uniref:glycosyltransferase n=1 Tax=uncultured Draconibacterium sp. TaxID=1573823 RepID=UPI0029C8625F|nr:glycosyltransferase [uncultured Draconibacterium sp.]